MLQDNRSLLVFCHICMRMYLQTCSRYLTFTFTKQNENGPFGKPGTDSIFKYETTVANLGLRNILRSY